MLVARTLRALKVVNNDGLDMVSGANAPRLLTERVSAVLGFKRIATKAGYPWMSPYLLPLTGWVFGAIFLSSLSYYLTGRDQFATPFFLIIPIGTVVALRLANWVRDYYVTTAKSLPGEELDETDFLPMPTHWIPEGFFVVFYIGYLFILSLSPEEVSAFVATHGKYIAYAKYIFGTPFYIIVIADVAALLVASMLLLPWKVYECDLTLDFYDVSGFAGLYEVSRLLRVGAVTYFIGLTIWTAFLITPSIAGGELAVSPLDKAVFAGLWVLGLLMYLAPFLLLHRHMSREKEFYIRQINAEIQLLSPNNYDKDFSISDPNPKDVLQFQQKFIELQQVRESREYPVNMTTLEDIIIGALVPIVFERLLTILIPML